MYCGVVRLNEAFVVDVDDDIIQPTSYVSESKLKSLSRPHLFNKYTNDIVTSVHGCLLGTAVSSV